MEEFNKKNISVIILSAGFSNRMKSSKAILKFDENLNFIQKIVNTYENFGCDEILIILNSELFEKINQNNYLKFNDQIRYVINFNPEIGRFSSIKIGINNSKYNNKYCFIQNIDNPYINENILDLLYNNLSNYDTIIPSYNNIGGHPILINQKIINYIKNLDVEDYNLRDILKKFQSKKIETDDEKVLININTIEDYNQYFPNYKLS